MYIHIYIYAYTAMPMCAQWTLSAGAATAIATMTRTA